MQESASRRAESRLFADSALHIDRYPEERRGNKKEVMLTAEQMARLLEAIEAAEEAGANPIACSARDITKSRVL